MLNPEPAASPHCPCASSFQPKRQFSIHQLTRKILPVFAGLLILLLGYLPAAATPVPPDSVRRAPLDSLVRAQCPGYPVLRVASILFVGNEVTKERILRAELDFREGDTVSAPTLTHRLEANRLRVFNLQLFHHVLTQVVCRNGELTVLFSVQERWYTFPVPILSLADRNFRSWLDRPDRWRRVDYGLHVERKNFRGATKKFGVICSWASTASMSSSTIRPAMASCVAWDLG
ncbi:POTRA domain-containing protein [Hymenobacter cellulosilyticus]|uniref:POTRA domain-containing protein n=1 Tax=Hymenobacter cellulosilyticus TaxID=2932248 RepID=A0A8T9Q8F7_9BACT|nr:POTRA domain-containing protein [Hymenobacter cellulosilyticus]UOQ73774.1 hypothetical protein MUN79_07615 [Hymenobacter cellulosilyticus]